MFLSLATGHLLYHGYQSYTAVPMPDHAIAHIDALGLATAADTGVHYFDDTNLDTDYEPLNDVSTNSPDEPLVSDFLFLPITAAGRDWIRIPDVNPGVAGHFNNDDDDGSTNSDGKDKEHS
jgi:hypothetical protein